MDLEALLKLLSDRGIKFIVVGGVACALNGFIRATEDLDILVETSQTNIIAMLATLQEWGEGFAKELDLSDFSVSPGAVRLIEDFPLDIFTVLDQQTYEDLLPQTRITEQGIVYLNRSAIINIKKKSMREKDRIDVLALEKISDT